MLFTDKLKEIVSAIRNEFAFDIEATGKDPMADSIVGFFVSAEKETGYYIPTAFYLGRSEQIGMKETMAIVAPIF